LFFVGCGFERDATEEGRELESNKSLEEMSCFEIGEEIDEFFEKENVCNVDSDCIRYDDDYKILYERYCKSFINKNTDATKLKKISQLLKNKECGHSPLKCIGNPTLKCDNNRCVEIKHYND